VIHYHGTPLTPNAVAARTLAGRHAFISFNAPQSVEIAADVCQSFALDNGAFAAWKGGRAVNWNDYYSWAEKWLAHPACDWAVIPDVIDGDEAANDALLLKWPHGPVAGVPVWHLHESIERLQRLAATFPRVALGSSGEWRLPGAPAWWERMQAVLPSVCDSVGRPKCKLHGLRMLAPKIFTKLPFASADSTNVARNANMDSRWRDGSYPPPKEWRATIIAVRIEAFNASTTLPLEWLNAEPPELEV
jgi:hypothetical protein